MTKKTKKIYNNLKMPQKIKWHKSKETFLIRDKKYLEAKLRQKDAIIKQLKETNFNLQKKLKRENL